MHCGSMRLHTAGFHSTLWLPLPIACSAGVHCFWESLCYSIENTRKYRPVSVKWGCICWVSGLKWRVEEMDCGSCWYSYWIYWGRRPAIWSPSTGIPSTKGKSSTHWILLHAWSLNCRFELWSFPAHKGRKNWSNNCFNCMCATSPEEKTTTLSVFTWHTKHHKVHKGQKFTTFFANLLHFLPIFHPCFNINTLIR